MISNHLLEILKSIKQRIVKLVVWNMDGSTSEMKFYFPVFCTNGDDSNRIGQHLEEWAREMTRYDLKITHYQVFFGVQYNDDTEVFNGGKFDKKEVPLGKLFEMAKADQGEWLTPEEAKESQRAKAVRFYEKQMNQGKHPLSGAHIRACAYSQIWKN